ncbi:MAG: hypothetical protein ILP12_06800 [Lachnospiraceae bacterium]|nr:hypothetical protein [Lachnospiraceae bacterium]
MNFAALAGPLLAAQVNPWVIVGIVVGVAALILVALYFIGRNLQKKQDAAQVQIDAMKQTVSMLIIDKKMLKPKDSGLPEAAVSQIPWYAKNAKLPVVKAKVGPQIMSLIAEREVFDIIPVKKECKVSISGMYITELKSVRGGKIPEKPKKTGFWQRLFGKKETTDKKQTSRSGK